MFTFCVASLPIVSSCFIVQVLKYHASCMLDHFPHGFVPDQLGLAFGSVFVLKMHADRRKRLYEVEDLSGDCVPTWEITERAFVQALENPA